jgi:hypothetical protein
MEVGRHIGRNPPKALRAWPVGPASTAHTPTLTTKHVARAGVCVTKCLKHQSIPVSYYGAILHYQWLHYTYMTINPR